jgi:hypothetical protein
MLSRTPLNCKEIDWLDTTILEEKQKLACDKVKFMAGQVFCDQPGSRSGESI